MFLYLAVQLVEEAVEDEVGGVVVLEHLRLGHPHAALRHPVALDAVGGGGIGGSVGSLDGLGGAACGGGVVLWGDWGSS